MNLLLKTDCYRISITSQNVENSCIYNTIPTRKAPRTSQSRRWKELRAGGLGYLLQDCVFCVGQGSFTQEISSIWLACTLLMENNHFTLEIHTHWYRQWKIKMSVDFPSDGCSPLWSQDFIDFGSYETIYNTTFIKFSVLAILHTCSVHIMLLLSSYSFKICKFISRNTKVWIIYAISKVLYSLVCLEKLTSCHI